MAHAGRNPLVQRGNVFVAGKTPECHDCVLILTGTSTQTSDVEHLVQFLSRAGDCAVAVIERFIGNPLDLACRPMEERCNDLIRMITELVEQKGIQRIHVIAHSYAAFEIVKLLSEQSCRYSTLVKNVIMVNPVGFSGRRRYLRHCLRFLFVYVPGEFICALKGAIRGAGRSLAARRWQATRGLLVKSLLNLTRTMKEVVDIERYRIGPALHKISRNGFRFFFVVNTSDTLIAPGNVMAGAREVVPPAQIMTFPGNHMEPLINEEIMGAMYRLLRTGMTEPLPC